MTLSPGRYKAKLLYHMLTENNTGNQELRITALPYETEDGRSLSGTIPPIPIFMTLTDKTIGTPDNPGWVLETLKSIGFNSSNLEDLNPESETAHSFAGQEVTLLASIDEYKGKSRTRWSIVRQGLRPYSICKIPRSTDHRQSHHSQA